jgi:hypothetical protein
MKIYCENIGQTITQFHTLEFILRNFLFLNSKNKNINEALPIDFFKLRVKDETAETEFTNYDSFGGLIEKANKILVTKGAKLIDMSLVEVRDCLAHGRVASVGISKGKILLKFTKPKDRKAKLTHRLELSEDWFKMINKKLFDSIKMLDCLSN